jgi:excisionase family DNA binding protein
MSQLLTPKQVARAIGASEASLKRWCDKGLLETTRTAGGHRRIELSAVMQFLRKSNKPLVDPEIIGLPATCGKTEAVLDRAAPRLVEQLEHGSLRGVETVLFDLYLADHSIAAIADRVIQPAFDCVGHGWEEGRIEVYQEHRATEIMLRALYGLSHAIPDPPLDGPGAVAATLCGSPYQLTITLIEMALRERGWNAESLGPNHPAETLVAALNDRRPELLCISVNWFRSCEEFLDEYNQISQAAETRRIPVAVGGSALTPDLREQMRYATFCDGISHLEGFVRVIDQRETASSDA